jgi:hypothetical protein
LQSLMKVFRVRTVLRFQFQFVNHGNFVKISCEPVCAQLASQPFSASETQCFLSALP